MSDIGGQAVIEGVMMKHKSKVAIATHKDGVISVKIQNYNSIKDKYKFLNFPIIRGIVNLFETMHLGFTTLNYSAEQYSGDGEKTPLWQSVLMIVFSIGFAILIFKLLPLFITKSFSTKGYFGDGIMFNIVDGVLRISVFIIYLLIISRFEDVKRIFQFHGAEHKTINCYEKNEALTIENVKKHSAHHPRCGTSFVFIVFIIFIIIATFTPTNLPFYKLFLLRLLLVFPVAGIAYEFLKLSGKFRDSTFMKVLSFPGMLIQRITTSEPDEMQIKAAISALEAVKE